jgi:hypothetical protein
MVAESDHAEMTADQWLCKEWVGGQSPRCDAALGRRKSPGTPFVARTGGVVGNVVDWRGRPVAARVFIRGAGSTVSRECHPVERQSGPAEGWFQCCDLPAGPYVLTVEAPGFRSEHRGELRVEAYGIAALGTIRLLPEGSALSGLSRRLRFLAPACCRA